MKFVESHAAQLSKVKIEKAIVVVQLLPDWSDLHQS